MVRLTVMQGCRRKADFEVQLDQLLQHSTVGLIPAQGFQIRISSTFMLSPEFHLPRDIVHDIPDVPVISFMKVIEREFIQSFQLCCQLCRRNTTTLKQRHHAQRVVLAPTVRLVLSAQLLPAHGHGALVSLHRPPARYAVRMMAAVEHRFRCHRPTYSASHLSLEVSLHHHASAVLPLVSPVLLFSELLAGLQAAGHATKTGAPCAERSLLDQRHRTKCWIKQKTETNCPLVVKSAVNANPLGTFKRHSPVPQKTSLLWFGGN
mmetsp:Transcript_26106/g.58632  ORF Transcript_26106/g.58632 Transcript_26106/m.58632 type:complete len:263 (+) Transcript_26106:412-1200(+)